MDIKKILASVDHTLLRQDATWDEIRAVCDDGINFSSPQKWLFDDGNELVTSSTQQHWFCLCGKLYLAYTRKSCENAGIFRYRTPLWASEVIVDGEKLRLKKSAETIILPIKRRNSDAGLCGNFHTVLLSHASSR